MEGNAKSSSQKFQVSCFRFQDKGQTLVELLLALGIFAFIMTAVFALVFGGLTTGLRTEEQDYATMYAQEGLDAARSIRDTDWNAFISADDAPNTHGVANSGSGWSWSGSNNETTYGARKFTREIFVEGVYRDSNNNIFTGESFANFDYATNGDYQCEGTGTCPSTNIDNIAGTAQLKEIISMNPRELTSDANTKALYRFNLNDGKELALGDLGGAPDANLKGLWHLNDMALENVSPPASSFSGAGGGTWPYRSPISIKGSASALSDYQMLITMNTAYLISAGKMKSDGSDIRFTNSSGSELLYWIESGINTIATKIWVKVNFIAASPSITPIYMYYGNPSATTASSWNNTFAPVGTYAQEIVADTNTKGLWRMNNNWNDSSSSAYNGTVYPTGANLFNTTTPKLGTASGQFDGITNATPRNSQHVELGLWNSLTNIRAATGSWTYEAWVKTNSNGYILNVTDTGDRVTLGVSGGKAVFTLVDYSILTTGKTATSTTIVNNDIWHHLAGVRSGDNIYIYVDGKLEGSNSGITSYNLAMSSWSPTWVFGGQWDSCCVAGGSRFSNGLAGSIDEIHISNSARDFLWITKNAGVRQVVSPAPEVVTVDLSGNNNNGSLYNGVSFPAAGKFSNALSFNGSSYVNAGTSSVLDFTSGDLTFEAWIYPANVTGWKGILGKYNGSTGGYILALNGGQPAFWRNGVWYYGTAGSIAATQWQHIAVKLNSGTLTFYVNGSSQASNSAGPVSSPLISTAQFQIGAGGSNWSPFTGSIDEMAVYDAALPATGAGSIQEHYNRGIANDSTSNNNDGKIIGPVTIVGNTGLNDALSFDGVDDYVSVGDNDSFSPVSKTVEAWVKFNALGSNDIIAGKGNEYWLTYNGLSGAGCPQTGKFSFMTNSGSTWTCITGTTTVTTGIWYHVAGTYDGTNMRLYVNGNLEAGPTAAGAQPNNIYPFDVGSYSGGATTYALNGSIDEVAVWDKALTQADIWDHIGANVGYQINSYATVKRSANFPATDYIDKFKELVETATIPAGTSIDYQLSTDNCTNMKYWDGDSWENAGGWNDARTITRYINFLPPTLTVPHTICLSARLNTTDANQTPVLDNVEIKYSQNKDNAITWLADVHTKKVTSRVKWPSGFSFQDLELTEYLTDWMYPEFITDTETEFIEYNALSTNIKINTDGSIELQNLLDSGEYESIEKDMGAGIKFLKVSWETVLSGGSANITVETAPDNSGLPGGWIASTFSLTDGSGSAALDPLIHPNTHQWVRFRVNILANSPSPKINKITIQAKNLY